MRKIELLILLILFNIFNSYSYAEESGWVVINNLRTQKQKIGALEKIRFSENKLFIYTLHNKSTLNIWDYKSGKNIDKFVLDSNILESNISEDGNSLISVENSNYNGKSYNITINIYSLPNKMLLSKSFLTLPGDIEGCSLEGTTSNLKIDNIDYNTKLSTLSIMFNYNRFQYYGGVPSGSSNDICGGFAIFKVFPDKLILIKQIVNKPINDILIIDDIIFYTDYSQYSSNVSSSSTIHKTKENTYNFTKFDTKEVNIITNKYKYNYYWQHDKQATESSSGINEPFLKIFYNQSNYLFFITSKDKYYTYSLHYNWISSPFLFYSDSPVIMNKDAKYFIYSKNQILYFQNSINKKIEDSLQIPFTPNNLTLSVDETSLLLTDTNGNIVLIYLSKFANVITDNVEKYNLIPYLNKDIIEIQGIKSDEKFKLAPNPCNNIIEIQRNDNKEFNSNLQNDEIEIIGKVEVFNMMGLKQNIKSFQLDNKIILDVSLLSTGIYFIKYGSINQSFMKE